MRNKTTDQGMNELLALVQPFLQDGLHNFPGTAAQQARRFFSEFMNTLKLRSVEICANGCHRLMMRGGAPDRFSHFDPGVTLAPFDGFCEFVEIGGSLLCVCHIIRVIGVCTPYCSSGPLHC